MEDTQVKPMEAMAFFRLSAGRWRSQRTTHHLLLRRSETGQTDIEVQTLEANDPRVVEICKLHGTDPSLTVGGCVVSWDGSMAWDSRDDRHEGTTIFVLVPETPYQGQLLREQGYAESVPVVGHYRVDKSQGLVLTTEYETTSVVERFCFMGKNIRLRTNTVKQFGGFSTASFCIEHRVTDGSQADALQNACSGVDVIEFTPLGW